MHSGRHAHLTVQLVPGKCLHNNCNSETTTTFTDNLHSLPSRHSGLFV